MEEEREGEGEGEGEGKLLKRQKAINKSKSIIKNKY